MTELETVEVTMVRKAWGLEPVWEKGTPVCPFDLEKNEMLYEPYWWDEDGRMKWMGFRPFAAEMELLDGGSGGHFKLESVNTGMQFSIFPTDLVKLIRNNTLVNGVTPELTWEATKRSGKFAIKAAE